MSKRAISAIRRVMKACEALAGKNRLKHGNAWGDWSSRKIDAYCTINCTRGVERVAWFTTRGDRISKKDLEGWFVRSTEPEITEEGIYPHDDRIDGAEREAERLEELLKSGAP